MVRIVTHSHTFHPDEILAIALLQRTVLRDLLPVPIVRTRDPGVLAEAQADRATYVIDVGFVYDPAALNFDHHQASMTATWADGTPYSACGLVWVWLREQGALAEWIPLEALQDAMEEAVVRPADRYDNGLGGAWPEGEFIAGYNRHARDPAVGEAMFHRALTVAGDFLDNTLERLRKAHVAQTAVQEAIAHHLTPEGLLVMPDNRSDRYAHWAAVLAPDRVHLLVVPRVDGSWTLVTPPLDPADDFSRKTPAPPAWRGRNDFVAETADGPVTLAFCHKTGFLSVVVGELTDALRAGREVVRHVQQVGRDD
jgi:uncharacterized UPF0160 family protein